MKRILLLLLGGVLCSGMAMAQISINQRGKATHEMKSDGISISHPSLPINSTVRVTNTKTGKEVDATVVDRIAASPNRIADLSAGAWQTLGLDADTDIRISSIPAVRQRASATPPPPPAPAPAPPPVVAQADPPPAAPPPATPPAGQNADALNLTINNMYDTPTAKAPPPAPAPAPRYAPDADLQVRLAAVSAMAQQYGQRPPVMVQSAPPPPPSPPPPPVQKEVKVVESPVYQVLIVPVYQIQQPAPPPPQPVYVQPAPVVVAPAPPPVVVAPVAPAPVVVAPAPVMAAPAYTNLRVYPGFPDPNSGRMYGLQVASYLVPEAANRAAYMVRNAGFNVIQEQNLPYYRVIVPNIPASMVYSAIQRLGATGVVEEIWVR